MDVVSMEVEPMDAESTMDAEFLLSHSKLLSMTSKDIIGTKTRAQTAVSTSSCRMWQLILCILDQLQRKGYYGVKELIAGQESAENMEYYNMVYNVSLVLHNISMNPTLNDLIYSNDTFNNEIKEYDPETIPLINGHNYMCIYIEGVRNSILHYFTIIQKTDGKQYLNSSYGSDYVCVPQYTTELGVDELNRFISALNNPNTDEDYIGEFYQKFFLAGNIGVYYSKDDYENNPSLRFAKIAPDEGNLREIEVVTKNFYRSSIRCGIIPNYGELVGSVIDSVLYSGGRRKAHGKRKTNKHGKRKTNKHGKRKTNKHGKRKTNKHGKRIHRKSKRRHSSRSSKRCSR
jgi:hypothetical protein